MAFFEFPNARTFDSDLTWIIDKIKELLAQCGSLSEAWKKFQEEFQEQLSDTVMNILQEWLDDGTLLTMLLDVPFVNVSLYGLKGDGITDNTDLFQNMYEKFQNGAIFYFPSGKYMFSAKQVGIDERSCCIKINTNNTFIRGEYNAILSQFQREVNTDLLVFDGCNNIGIDTITLDGASNLTSTDIGGINLWVNACNMVSLEKITSQFSGGWLCRLDNSNYITVENYTAKPYIGANEDNIHIISCNNVYCRNLDLTGIGDDAIAIENQGGTCKNLFFENVDIKKTDNTKTTNRGIAIFCDSGYPIAKIENVSFINTSVSAPGSAVVLYNCQISGFNFQGELKDADIGFYLNPTLTLAEKITVHATTSNITRRHADIEFGSGNYYTFVTKANSARTTLLKSDNNFLSLIDEIGSLNIEGSGNIIKLIASGSISANFTSGNNNVLVGILKGTTGAYFAEGTSNNVVIGYVSTSSGATSTNKIYSQT